MGAALALGREHLADEVGEGLEDVEQLLGPTLLVLDLAAQPGHHAVGLGALALSQLLQLALPSRTEDGQGQHEADDHAEHGRHDHVLRQERSAGGAGAV